MKSLIANILLALLWVMLTGSTRGLNVVFGLVVGYLVLHLTQGSRRKSAYFRKVPLTIAFLAFFLKEIVVSSLRVAHDVLTPRLHMRPAILGIPLDAQSDAEITLLGCLVSLTPGTLTLDLSGDRKTLFVHAMFVRDYGRTIASIKDGYEKRILRLMR